MYWVIISCCHSYIKFIGFIYVCIFIHSMFQHPGIYIFWKTFFYCNLFFLCIFITSFSTQRGKSNVCPPFCRLELEYKMCWLCCLCPWQGVLDTTLFNTVWWWVILKVFGIVQVLTDTMYLILMKVTYEKQTLFTAHNIYKNYWFIPF